MSVRLDSLVSAIAAEAGLDPDRVSQDATNIKRWVNDTRREIYELPVQFSSLEFSGELVGVANVTAGTVNATQNQAEITGAGTAWTSSMGGRYIGIGTQPWQRISYVTDTTHLTLESSWNNATSTLNTYKIWKRDYQLPGKVAHVKRLINLAENRKVMSYFDQSEFYSKYGFGDNFAPPEAWTQFAQSDLADSFLARTIYTGVTATGGSNIVDFSGTQLTTALAPGDRLYIGNATTSTAFFVDRVLTDTRIALTHLCTISTGGTSATAETLNRLNIRIYPAIDSTTVIYFEGQKHLYDLFDNADILERGWYSAVKKGAIAKAMGYVNSPREQQKLKEYDLEVAKLIRDQYKAANPAIRLKVNIPTRYSYGSTFGNFPTNYDRSI